MTRMSPAIRSNTQAHIKGLKKQASNDAFALGGAREGLRLALMALTGAEWDALFLSDTDPERAAKIAETIPHYRSTAAVYYDRVRRLEENMGALLREAGSLQRKLDLDGPFYLEVEEPGLWTLLKLCWLGWRRTRALQ